MGKDRYVRTPEGAKKFGQPINSKIKKDSVGRTARGVLARLGEQMSLFGKDQGTLMPPGAFADERHPGRGTQTDLFADTPAKVPVSTPRSATAARRSRIEKARARQLELHQAELERRQQAQPTPAAPIAPEPEPAAAPRRRGPHGTRSREYHDAYEAYIVRASGIDGEAARAPRGGRSITNRMATDPDILRLRAIMDAELRAGGRRVPTGRQSYPAPTGSPASAATTRETPAPTAAALPTPPARTTPTRPVRVMDLQRGQWIEYAGTQFEVTGVGQRYEDPDRRGHMYIELRNTSGGRETLNRLAGASVTTYASEAPVTVDELQTLLEPVAATPERPRPHVNDPTVNTDIADMRVGDYARYAGAVVQVQAIEPGESGHRVVTMKFEDGLIDTTPLSEMRLYDGQRDAVTPAAASRARESLAARELSPGDLVDNGNGRAYRVVDTPVKRSGVRYLIDNASSADDGVSYDWVALAPTDSVTRIERSNRPVPVPATPSAPAASAETHTINIRPGAMQVGDVILFEGSPARIYRFANDPSDGITSASLERLEGDESGFDNGMRTRLRNFVSDGQEITVTRQGPPPPPVTHTVSIKPGNFQIGDVYDFIGHPALVTDVAHDHGSTTVAIERVDGELWRSGFRDRQRNYTSDGMTIEVTRQGEKPAPAPAPAPVPEAFVPTVTATDLAGLRNRQNAPLDPSGVYRVGRGSIKYRIDKVNDDLTLNLVPVNGGRRKNNVRAAHMMPVAAAPGLGGTRSPLGLAPDATSFGVEIQAPQAINDMADMSALFDMRSSNLQREISKMSGRYGAYDVHFYASGPSTYGGKTEFSASGTIKLNGRDVGTVTRAFFRDSDGTMHVHNSFLRINRAEDRGKGFASNFYPATESWYRRSGVKYVDIQASLEDGAYTWAKSGFQWDPKYMRDASSVYNIRQSMARHARDPRLTPNAADRDRLLALAARLTSDNLADWPSPFEIATFTDSRGKEQGRKILKGAVNEWYGIKYL